MTFVKGDPRINRTGRPRSFDKLRDLAQELSDEIARDQAGQPVTHMGEVMTNIEVLMRKMMIDDPGRFVEIAYGKVPTPPLDITSDGGPISISLKWSEET